MCTTVNCELLLVCIFPFFTVGAQVIFPENGQLFTVNETSNITFTCVATGLPPPSITFLNGNQSLGPPRFIAGPVSSVPQNNTMVEVTATLTLINAMDEDSGVEGSCQAMNTVSELNETRMVGVNIQLVVNGE